MTICPRCKQDVICHGGDRLRSDRTGILYYVTWCYCDDCDIDFHTVTKINEEKEKERTDKRFRKMTCKRCGDSGYAMVGSETSKTRICPNCRLKEMLGGVDEVKSMKFEFE
jgi:hypothetical protein